MKQALRTAWLSGALMAAVAPAEALTITATYDSSLSASARTVITNALSFYAGAFTDPITVRMKFYNKTSGLGSSLTFIPTVSYTTYRNALVADATSANDATALANTPLNGGNNPVTGSPNIVLTTALARAVGISSGPFLFSGSATPCDGYTGDSCIGLNLAITNDTDLGTPGGYSLITVVQHEVNEGLGLGSALSDGSAPTNPRAEDLFRWAGAGVRSYATNSCDSPPPAYFSIDGGVTVLNQFDNCDNNADYGDWITHTPSQVQDALTNGSGSPFLTLNSSEVVALDVIGYTLVPEPASLALLGVGLLGLAAGRRRR